MIVYAALSGSNGGIWRSMDTGGHWKLLQAGNATDVVLVADSANGSGNLQILYGALQGLGVFFTPTAPTTASMSILNGGNGVPIDRDAQNTNAQIPVANATVIPTAPTAASCWPCRRSPATRSKTPCMKAGSTRRCPRRAASSRAFI